MPASSGPPPGAIAGIVIGLVLFLAAAGFLGFLAWRKRRRVNAAASAESIASEPSEYCGKPELAGTTAGNDLFEGSASGYGFSRKAELAVDGEVLTSTMQVRSLNEGQPLEMASGDVAKAGTEHRISGEKDEIALSV
jgi:hypothetical protein